MHQKIVTLTNPGGSFFGDTLRAEVAKTGLAPPIAFNHQDKETTLNSRPPIRFVATKGWVGAIFEEGAEDHLPGVVAAMTQVVLPKLTTETLTCRTHDATLAASATEQPITYAAKNIAVKRYAGIPKGKHCPSTFRQELRGAALLEYAIRQSLTQAYQSGLIPDLPPDEELELKILDTKDSGVGPHSLVSGTFQMRLNLTGLWQFGTLQSKGYGMIAKQNKGGFFQWIY